MASPHKQIIILKLLYAFNNETKMAATIHKGSNIIDTLKMISYLHKYVG